MSQLSRAQTDRLSKRLLWDLLVSNRTWDLTVLMESPNPTRDQDHALVLAEIPENEMIQMVTEQVHSILRTPPKTVDIIVTSQDQVPVETLLIVVSQDQGEIHSIIQIIKRKMARISPLNQIKLDVEEKIQDPSVVQEKTLGIITIEKMAKI